MGMIGDGKKAIPCQKADIEQIVCHKKNCNLPGGLHELSPVIERVYTVLRATILHIWHGTLTTSQMHRKEIVYSCGSTGWSAYHTL